jgi:hypothetical protein
MNRKTDKARLLAALRYEGARGITTLDFEPPHVWDEGDPIKQIARRIYDLRQEGHDIVTDGKRQGVAVYKLRQAPAETTRDLRTPVGDGIAVKPLGAPDPECLFQVGMQPARSSAYFGEDAA